MTPPSLGAKEFEDLLLQGANRAEKAGLLSMARYGVQVSLFNGEWTPISSLPDFDGVVRGGRQFIIEAKKCEKSALAIDKKTIKPRQVRHMLSRARMGVRCFVVIHFCERQGKTFHDPAQTLAIPVNDEWSLWQDFLDGKPVTGINRQLARRRGRKVEWTKPKGCQKALPDLAGLLGVEKTEPDSLL